MIWRAVDHPNLVDPATKVFAHPLEARPGEASRRSGSDTAGGGHRYASVSDEYLPLWNKPPNAGAHQRPEAGATQERMLEAVGW